MTGLRDSASVKGMERPVDVLGLDIKPDHPDSADSMRRAIYAAVTRQLTPRDRGKLGGPGLLRPHEACSQPQVCDVGEFLIAPSSPGNLGSTWFDIGAFVDHDWETKVRLATFERLRKLREDNGGAVPSGLLEERLAVEGVEIAIMSRQKGIHQPAQLEAALTVKTSVSGRYDDRINVGEAAMIRYHYRDPASQGSRAMRMAQADNRAVRAVMSSRLPIAYLLGVDKGWYLPFAPVNVVADDQAAREFTIDLTEIAGIALEDDWRLPDMAAEAPTRQYRIREVKYRVHQVRFRQMVLKAYRAACAMCSLKHVDLLDAAHILEDAGGGEPQVSNGIALCKIHHAAFDRHILGVEPDNLEVHVRQDVLTEVDGPMLQYGLQSMHRQRLALPRRVADRPSLEALGQRWDHFRAA